MTTTSRSVRLLCAEDDEDDREMIRDAFDALEVRHELTFVADGAELLDVLRPPRSAADGGVRPALILLDLNMPRVNGREALREIKADPELRQIPVVVMTTSQAEADISASYGLGANSYIVKPVTFDELVAVMRGLEHYWLHLVELPITGEMSS